MIFNERPENIFIYHFVEELMSDYGTYYEFNLKEDELTLKEYSILLKIRYEEVTSQHDLVKMFKVSNAYIAKILRKYEEKQYIVRNEDSENRRKKIVKITKEGIEKTDKLIEIITNWEEEITCNLTDDEILILKKILLKCIKGE